MRHAPELQVDLHLVNYGLLRLISVAVRAVERRLFDAVPVAFHGNLPHFEWEAQTGAHSHLLNPLQIEGRDLQAEPEGGNGG